MIDSVTEKGEIVARVVAESIVEELRTHDPAFLAEWLDARAGEILGDYIRDRLNSRRATARVMHSRSVFAAAASSFEETGDVASFSAFDALVVVNEDNLRRRVGDMTKEDCLFVAHAYGRSRREAEMYERFHLALAEKLGDSTVRDVYTEEQYRAMLSSFAS